MTQYVCLTYLPFTLTRFFAVLMQTRFLDVVGVMTTTSGSVVVVVGAMVVVAAGAVVVAAATVVVVVVVGAVVPNLATRLATVPTAQMLLSGPTVRPLSPNELGAGYGSRLMTPAPNDRRETLFRPASVIQTPPSGPAVTDCGEAPAGSTNSVAMAF